MPNVTFNSPKPAEDAETKVVKKKQAKAKEEVKVVEEPEVVETKELVTQDDQSVELGVSRTNVAVGGMGGDMDEVDFTPPKLQIVQATGDLSSDFAPGSIVVNGETLINPAPDPVTDWSDPLYLSVLYAKLTYKENLDYDSDDIPDHVDTLKEVLERGGSVKWQTDSKTGQRVEPSWIHVLANAVVIEGHTDEAKDAFTLADPEDNPCELAMWYVQKSAFSRAGKYIINQGKTSLRDRSTGQPQLHHGRFSLQVRREKLGNYQVFVPRLRLVSRHTPEYVQWLSELL